MNTLKLVSVVVVCALAGGCSSLRPSAVGSYWEHTSHPLAGYPVGPANEEDTLDTVNVSLIWKRESFRIEQSLGYKLRDGGFYGPKLTYTLRAGYEIPLRKP